VSSCNIVKQIQLEQAVHHVRIRAVPIVADALLEAN
jgi:hypothetical protein